MNTKPKPSANKKTKAHSENNRKRPVEQNVGAPRPLAIIRNDAWLEPYAAAIEGRHQDAIRAEKRLTSGSAKTLEDFANAHEYFGLHRLNDGRWCFREWAPNATAITSRAISATGNGCRSMR